MGLGGGTLYPGGRHLNFHNPHKTCFATHTFLRYDSAFRHYLTYLGSGCQTLSGPAPALNSKAPLTSCIRYRALPRHVTKDVAPSTLPDYGGSQGWGIARVECGP